LIPHFTIYSLFFSRPFNTRAIFIHIQHLSFCFPSDMSDVSCCLKSDLQDGQPCFTRLTSLDAPPMGAM
jgi:hypothetical protein